LRNVSISGGESYRESQCGNSTPSLLREVKMNRRDFVSIIRIRAGQSNFEECLNRVNILSTAECECRDGLQTEEHILWDCELHEGQRATMMGILSESNKKVYPKSLTEFLSLMEKKLFKAPVTS
jgi:hypothetical protein